MFITRRLIESVQMLQAAQEVQRPNRLGQSISRDDLPLKKSGNMVHLLSLVWPALNDVSPGFAYVSPAQW